MEDRAYGPANAPNNNLSVEWHHYLQQNNLNINIDPAVIGNFLQHRDQMVFAAATSAIEGTRTTAVAAVNAAEATARAQSQTAVAGARALATIVAERAEARATLIAERAEARAQAAEKIAASAVNSIRSEA